MWVSLYLSGKNVEPRPGRVFLCDEAERCSAIEQQGCAIDFWRVTRHLSADHEIGHDIGRPAGAGSGAPPSVLAILVNPLASRPRVYLAGPDVFAQMLICTWNHRRGRVARSAWRR